MTAAETPAEAPDEASAPAAPPPPSGSLLRYAPALLLLLALALRLYGVTWALPDTHRYYSYHVDESVVVGHALELDPLAGKVDPGFYNYGSLALLLDAGAIRGARAAHLAATNDPSTHIGGIAVATAGELLCARLLSVAFGAGAVGFVAGAGRLFYGASAGVVAGALLAVAPLAVQHAHFATVDIPALFFLAGGLYFAARFYAAGAKPADLLWCGVWAGLAGAAKYNGILVVLSGAAAWWLAAPRRPLPLALLAGGAVAGFVAGCPGALLNPATLVRDFRFEANHVATGHGDVFAGTPPGFLYHVYFNLGWGLGLPLLIVALFAVGVAAVRRRPGDAILAAFALPYYLLIGVAQVKFARYTLPLFPPLLLLVGAAWGGWRAPRTATAVRAVVAAAGIFALLFSAALDQVMTLPDPRDTAADYLRSLPRVETVGFPAGPWFYSPNLSPLLAHPYPPVAQLLSAQPGEKPRLLPSRAVIVDRADGVLKPLPVEWYWNYWEPEPVPDALAFGELHYEYALRTHDKNAYAFLAAANRALPRHRNFVQPITLLGIPFVPERVTPGPPTYGLPVQGLPPDMLYTNQGVSVWTK